MWGKSGDKVLSTSSINSGKIQHMGWQYPLDIYQRGVSDTTYYAWGEGGGRSSWNIKVAMLTDGLVRTGELMVCQHRIKFVE